MSIIIPANSAAGGGFTAANSLMFNSADSASLSRTMGTSTSELKHTCSMWFKRSKLSSEQFVWMNREDGSNRTYFRFNATDTISFQNDGGSSVNLQTTQKFRDVGAWYNIVIAIDTTQATSSNRVKIYINGVQITSFIDEVYPAEDAVFSFNNVCSIGSNGDSSLYFGGYIAETVIIDGTQNAPTDFGEFDEDSGIWKPISVSGLTFGNNGFYLDFEDSSALGNDAVGSNNFTANNLAATDQATDTCTNNFATLNSIYKNYNQPTFTQGNTTTSSASSGYFNAFSSIAVSTGKWYAEIKRGSSESQIGISSLNDAQTLFPQADYYIGETSKSLGISNADGKYRIGTTATTYAASYTTGDIIGLALDLTNKKLYASKNGAWANGSGTWDSTTFNASTGAIDISAVIPSGEYAYIGFSIGDPGTGFIANFGFPTFSISSGNADDDGYGNFEYDVPGGYFSLNTKNLAEYG